MRRRARWGSKREELVHKIPSAYFLLHTSKGFKDAHTCVYKQFSVKLKFIIVQVILLRERHVKIPTYRIVFSHFLSYGIIGFDQE